MLSGSCADVDTDGLLHQLRNSSDLPKMAQEMAPVKKALIAADLPKLKSDLV